MLHPRSVDSKAPPWWEADYEEDGLCFTVPNCATNQCPVSAISGTSLHVLDTFFRLQAAKDMGASIDDFDDWPSPLHDGLLSLLNEQTRYENALSEARARRRST